MVVAQKPELCCNSKQSHEQITASSLQLSIGRLFAHKYMNGTHTHTHTNTHTLTHTHRL